MQLAYEEHGSGPTLVLLHGIVHRRQAWDPVLDRLTDHRRVITVDLPGHGESPDLPEGDDALAIATDILQDFIDEVTPAGERVHVAGNSLGGWAALVLGAQGRAASATALAPAGFFYGRLDQARTINTFKALRGSARTLGRNLSRAQQNKAVRSIAQGVFYAKPWRISVEDAQIDAAALLTNKVFDRGVDADFTLPAPIDPTVNFTVAWGRRDLVLPAYQARRVRLSFPTAELIMMPGVGHVPMSDDPALISRILLEGSSGPYKLDAQSTVDRQLRALPGPLPEVESLVRAG